MNNTYNSVFLKYNALYPYGHLIYIKYVILYVIYVYSLESFICHIFEGPIRLYFLIEYMSICIYIITIQLSCVKKYTFIYQFDIIGIYLN